MKHTKHLCFLIAGFVYCISKQNCFITLIINEMNYIYCYLFCLYKKKPTDYCGLSISVIYISIVTVAVSILVCETVDNYDWNHKKIPVLKMTVLIKIWWVFAENTTELPCMFIYLIYSTIIIVDNSVMFITLYIHWFKKARMNTGLVYEITG